MYLTPNLQTLTLTLTLTLANYLELATSMFAQKVPVFSQIESPGELPLLVRKELGRLLISRLS